MIPPLPILAVDPGCSKAGHARITLHRSVTGGHFAFDRGGHREPSRSWLRPELQLIRDEGGVFALEVLIGGAFQAHAVQMLNETAEMQGYIMALAEEVGVPVLRIPAGNGAGDKARHIRGWRDELCHNPKASDKQIAAVVEAMVTGIPYLRHEVKPHVFDALGLGLVAAHRRLGIALRLPPSVETALYLQREADKAKASEKRSGSRKLVKSRAQRQRIGDGVRAARAGR